MPSRGRRCPLPFHVPANERRPTCSAPAASIATEERAGDGPCWYPAPVTTIPLRCASAPLEKSPFTPTAVEVPDTSRSRSLTHSLAPRIMPPASTHLSEYRPPREPCGGPVMSV